MKIRIKKQLLITMAPEGLPSGQPIPEGSGPYDVSDETAAAMIAAGEAEEWTEGETSGAGTEVEDSASDDKGGKAVPKKKK